MEFEQARSVFVGAFKSAFKDTCGRAEEADGVLIVETRGGRVEVHVRDSGGAIEVYSKLSGVEGSGFFKHAKLAGLTAGQAEEMGKSSAGFCSVVLEKAAEGTGKNEC